MVIIYTLGSFILLVVAFFIIGTIWEYYSKSNKGATKTKFEQGISDFDTSDSFGDDNCTVYYDKSKNQIMIVAISLNNTKTKIIDNFSKTLSLFTKDCKYAYDNKRRQLLCIYTDGDQIWTEMFDCNENSLGSSSESKELLQPQILALGRVAVLVDEYFGIIRFVYFDTKFKQVTYKYSEKILPREKSYITFNYHFSDLANYYVVVRDDLAKVLVVINQNIVFKSFNYSDIMSVSYIENDETIYSESTTRTIDGSVVGCIVGGYVGDIIGGLSGGAKEHRIVSKMTLKLLIRSSQEPSYIFNLYIGKPLDLSKDLELYNHYFESGQRIKDLISVIIDATDRED